LDKQEYCNLSKQKQINDNNLLWEVIIMSINKNCKHDVIVIDEYVGGLSDILKKDTVSLFMNNEVMVVNYIINGKKIIPFEDIISIESKNQEQVSKNITIARLILSKIFKYNIKKTKTPKRKFIVVKYLDEFADEINLMVECKCPEIILPKMRINLKEYNKNIMLSNVK